MLILGRVENYSEAITRVEKSLDYPGNRPEGSFFTDGKDVVGLSENRDQFRAEVDELLKERGLPLMADRIPVLSYGANANPVRLQAKMAKFGVETGQTLLQTVPFLTSTIPGNVGVWHGRPSREGGIFAELYKPEDPEMADKVQLRSHVAYLTPEQLAVVHTSEGATYSAAEIPAIIGNAEKLQNTTKVLAYVALQGSLLLYNGQPVLITDLANTAEGMASMTATEAVEYMLNGVADKLGDVTREDFLHQGYGMQLEDKKLRQEHVRRLLTARGLSRPYEYPADAGRLIGRADLTSFGNASHVTDGKTDLVLPETLLDSIRPSAKYLLDLALIESSTSQQSAFNILKEVDNKHNPARSLSLRASDEIEVRLALNPISRQ